MIKIQPVYIVVYICYMYFFYIIYIKHSDKKIVTTTNETNALLYLSTIYTNTNIIYYYNIY